MHEMYKLIKFSIIIVKKLKIITNKCIVKTNLNEPSPASLSFRMSSAQRFLIIPASERTNDTDGSVEPRIAVGSVMAP